MKTIARAFVVLALVLSISAESEAGPLQNLIRRIRARRSIETAAVAPFSGADFYIVSLDAWFQYRPWGAIQVFVSEPSPPPPPGMEVTKPMQIGSVRIDGPHYQQLRRIGRRLAFVNIDMRRVRTFVGVRNPDGTFTNMVEL